MTHPQVTSLRESILAVSFIYAATLTVLLVSFFHIVDNMDYIIQRDPSFYWDRAYVLWQTLRDKGIFAWFNTILFSVTDNHTFVPSAIPSLAFQLLSSDSIRVYGVTVIVVYLAPIPVVGALVVSGGRRRRRVTEISTTGFLMLAAMYPFTVKLMPTSPDFGGNLFTSLALLFAGAAFVRLGDAAPSMALRPMVLTILAFLVGLFLSVIFRRWYAFDAVGLLAAFSLALLVAGASRGRDHAILVFQALTIAGLIFGVVLAPVLIPKLLVVVSGGIFEGSYDAYRANYLGTFLRFGGAELLCFTAILMFALVFHRSASRAFVLTALVGNVLGILLFLYIQAPGIHHFSLLWPMLLCSISVIVRGLFSSRPSAALGAGYAAASIAVAATVVAIEFPSAPRVDPNIEAYRQLADKIVDKKLQNKRFCVLGNQDIYFSLIENLWQVKGGRRGTLPSSVRIPEVDFGTADRYAQGGLARSMALCDWIITTDRLGLYHEPKFHRILRFHHEKIFQLDSVLGSAYELEERFDAGLADPVVFFRRKSGVVVDAEAFEADYLDWLANDKIALP